MTTDVFAERGRATNNTNKNKLHHGLIGQDIEGQVKEVSIDKRI